MALWAELRRRQVFKVGAAYLILAWLLAQIASVFSPALNLPDWVTGLVVFLLILGFPVALFLAWAYEITPQGIAQTRHLPGRVLDFAGRKLNYMLAFLLVATVGYIAIDDLVPGDTGSAVSRDESAPGSSERADEPDAPDESGPTEVLPRLPNSIAVLPFASLSRDDDSAFFAAGVHEQILSELAKIHDVNVIARTSVERYASDPPPVPQIATELNVETVMEGSVRYDGDAIRVAAQLIDGTTGVQLWSEVYDGVLADVFGIQTEIAGANARELEVELLPAERARMEASPELGTADLQAYELYLRGRYLWIQRGEEPIRRSIELFEAALGLDPEYAHAMAALAAAWLTLPGYTSTSVPDANAQARDYAERALAFDGSLGDAHAVLADLAYLGRNWLEAEERFARAIEVEPGNANAHYWYTEMLSSVGRWSDSLTQCGIALGLDPFAPAINADCSWSRLILGDPAGARDGFERAWMLGLHEMFVWQGLLEMHIELEQFDLAEQWLEEIPFPAGRELFAAYLRAIQDPAQAPAATQQFSSAYAAGALPAFQAVVMLSAIGAVDAAYKIAAANIDDPGYLIRTLFAHPTRDLRLDPRFESLIAGLGIVDYWRAREWPDFCAPQGDAIRCDR